jgi:parallel beta-helix repeat protein
MKRVVGLIALLIAVLTVTPAVADFYVIGGGGRLGTAITALPHTITSPGLYYLSNNLTSSDTAKNAITVDADDVTIDLMGFCLTGPGKTSGTGNNGILVAATRTNVEIRNGSIKTFGNDGIQSSPDCTSIRVVGLRVRDTGKYGIHLNGSDNLVMDCAVMKNSEAGVFVGNSSLVKGCQVGEGGYYGIFLYGGSTAVGNTVRASTYGIATFSGSSVTDNTVSGNSQDGISAGSNCTITRNTAYSNAGWGINTLTYCTITNNTTDALTHGANCTLADNTLAP